MTDRAASGCCRAATLLCVACLALSVSVASATNLRLVNMVGCVYLGSIAEIWTQGIENMDAKPSAPLRLELWAYSAPARSGSSVRLSVFPHAALAAGEVTGTVDSGPVDFAMPPPGVWYFTMVLAEYSGPSSVNDGYEMRYAIDFDEPEYIGVAPPAKQVQAVEFYHPGLDHYFITSSEREFDDLVGGAVQGWWPTGYTFNVWDGPTPGSSPVCRYYIPPASGDSHFYSAAPFECDAIPAMFPTFVKESAAAFYVKLPDPVTGACAETDVPVYRLWNGRSDSGHRYTTSAEVKAQMIAAGFVAEGFGPNGVAMCSPT